jgi:hypothetical protein
MKDERLADAGQNRAQVEATRRRVSSLAHAGPADDRPELLARSELFGSSEEEEARDETARNDAAWDADNTLEDTARLPKITRLPEGIEVIERSVGRAVGQWVLHVRCQCGRRWFELEPIDATTCPRCGMLVYLDVLARRD